VVRAATAAAAPVV